MEIHRVGILTGGGDAPGLNAVIRAFVKRAVGQLRWQVLGIEDSFDGILERPFRVQAMTPRSCSGLLARGGTVLGTTNKGDPFDYHDRGDVSGRIAEAGVDQNAPALIAHAKQELEAVLPGVDVSNTEWSTYRVDRAEMQTPQGKRPESVQIIREGNCITAWPTKLVLAPQLARQILADLPLPAPIDSQPIVRPNPWANPVVALPPWETATTWSRPGLAFLDFPTIRGRGLRAG